MMKPKRKKVVRQTLENILAKKERRIQQLAEDAYRIREVLRQFDKQEKTNALCDNSGKTEIGGLNGANQNSGESQLLDNNASQTILAEQSTELPSNQ